MTNHLWAATAEQTDAIACRVVALLPSPPFYIHLCGLLGAGKTAFARSALRALGGDRAPSPTFSLALSYNLPTMTVYHMDFFRLPSNAPLPEDIAELLQHEALYLIEWPQRILSPLPVDIKITFDIGESDGRHLHFESNGDRGAECLRRLFA